MKHPLVRVIAAATLGVTVAPTERPGAAQAPATALYTIQYLGGLGGNNSRGNSSNNDGWIAGYSNLVENTHRHAAIWINETPIDLGALGSPNRPKNSNVVWPVKNTRGLIVGISQTDSPDPWG